MSWRLASCMEEVEPVHGQAFFTLGMEDVFSQILVFDYYDPGRYYYRLLEDEEGVAEYDYEVYWFLPRGSRIIEVETSTDYEIFGERFLVMWARRGDRYSGHEKIVFTLP